jgi:hypothetical protein
MDYTVSPRDPRDTWIQYLTQIYESQLVFLNTNHTDHTNKIALRMATVSSVKSRWLFISSVSRESTRICWHTESTEHTELRFVSLSLHADEDILWILWIPRILCAILFSCLTRRRKGREGFYQRNYTDYTVSPRDPRDTWIQYLTQIYESQLVFLNTNRRSR